MRSAVTAPEAIGATDNCSNCGMLLELGDRFCPGCRQPIVERSQLPVADRVFECKNCGAQLRLEPSQRSYTCPFCDSNYVIESSVGEGEIPSPEFIIPFAVPREKAEEALRGWLKKSAAFLPAPVLHSMAKGTLRGVYLPFWSFSVRAESHWQALIGEYWYRTETYTVTVNGRRQTRTRRVRETEWWPLAGRFHRYWNGYLVVASEGLPQELADALQPYKLKSMKRYDASFLAGWAAENATVPAETAYAISEEEFRRWQLEAIADFLPGDTYRKLSADTQMKLLSTDLILLPVYFLSFKWKNRTYYVAVNGQTGKLAAIVPRSWGWVVLAVLVVILVLFGVGLAVRYFSGG